MPYTVVCLFTRINPMNMHAPYREGSKEARKGVGVGEGMNAGRDAEGVDNPKC